MPALVAMVGIQHGIGRIGSGGLTTSRELEGREMWGYGDTQ